MRAGQRVIDHDGNLGVVIEQASDHWYWVQWDHKDRPTWAIDCEFRALTLWEYLKMRPATWKIAWAWTTIVGLICAWSGLAADYVPMGWRYVLVVMGLTIAASMPIGAYMNTSDRWR